MASMSSDEKNVQTQFNAAVNVIQSLPKNGEFLIWTFNAHTLFCGVGGRSN